MLLHNTDNHLIRFYEKKEHLCTFTYMQHASFAYSKCQILLSLIHGEVLSGIIENVLIRHRTTIRLFHNDDTFFFISVSM